MQLALSSAAVPHASIDTLRSAARRRDLKALELLLGAGHGHGVGMPSKSPSSVNRRAIPTKGESPPVQWLLASKRPTITDLLYWGRQAALLDAGLLLQGTVPESPLGLPLALVHGTDLEEAQRAAAWARMHNARTGWTVELGQRTPEQFADVLEATASTLAHVRLLGAGPEAQSVGPDSLGAGTVLKELALKGYSGTVALAPSANGVTADWHEWLFEERGWGCNTAAKKKDDRKAAAT
jgi:hypothetical protein